MNPAEDVEETTDTSPEQRIGSFLSRMKEDNNLSEGAETLIDNLKNTNVDLADLSSDELTNLVEEALP